MPYSTVKGFRWPNRSYAPGSTRFAPTAGPTIDEIKFRVKASEKAKEAARNDQAARESQHIAAARQGERDVEIADKLRDDIPTVEEKNGQLAFKLDIKV